MTKAPSRLMSDLRAYAVLLGRFLSIGREKLLRKQNS